MHSQVVPKSTYFFVAAVLFALLVVTVVIAQIDLGYWNTPLAMLVALAKAALIVLFFMNVRHGDPLVRVFSAGGFLWLIIMFVLMLSDYLTRH